MPADTLCWVGRSRESPGLHYDLALFNVESIDVFIQRKWRARELPSRYDRTGMKSATCFNSVNDIRATRINSQFYQVIPILLATAGAYLRSRWTSKVVSRIASCRPTPHSGLENWDSISSQFSGRKLRSGLDPVMVFRGWLTVTKSRTKS
jgi:hypothetical protein